MKRTIWIVLGWLVLSCAAHAASFDCAKAGTKVEKLICDDVGLSTLDDELNATYKTALRDETQPYSIRQRQKQWVRARNSCSDVACVKRAYEVRLLSFAPKQTSSDSYVAKKQKAALQTKKPFDRYCAYDSMAEGCVKDRSDGNYAVCESYLKSLNPRSDTQQCGERLPPGFKRPDWEEVDVMKHLNWAYQIILEQGHESTDQNFESWSQIYIEQTKTGQIAPQMHKMQIHQPNGGDAVTLIGYKDNREGCSRPHDAPFQPGQSGFGYAYFRLLADDPAVRLLALGGEKGYVSTRTVSELLLYEDKPYFIQTWGDDYANPIAIDILELHLERHLVTKSEQEIYRVKDLYDVKRTCHLLPVN